jgi:inorganic triphosphatase YgiF
VFAQALYRSAEEAPISLEVELKLAVEPADLAELRRVLAACAADAAAISQRLVSTYFDTPDGALQQAGMILRVRERNGQFVQTVKTANCGETNLFARGEWEDRVTDNRPDQQAGESGSRIPTELAGALRPIFVSEIDRVAIDIEPRPGTRIEAAVDCGAIRTLDDTRSEPVSELELELKEGDPAAVYDLALELIETAPLRIDLRSKAERGYRLAEDPGEPVSAASLEPLALVPNMPVEDALQRIGRACLAHLLRNEPAALAGTIEGVHQMRVAMRRLRSVLSAAKKMLPEAEWRWVSGEVKVLTGTLGKARNLDVFATELLPPARDEAPDQPGWEELSDAAEGARVDAHRRVSEEIRSPRRTASLLRLLRWFDGRGWQQTQNAEADQALRVAIGTVATALLDRRRKQVRKRSRHFGRLPAQGRHRLRIAVKKLRYSVELLDSLYDARDVQPFIKRLKRVQDELGHANDVRVAYSLVIELARTAARAEPIADAGAQLLARHERALAEHENKLRRQVRRLNKARPFWSA